MKATILLMGNPNTGKSTLFNQLTGGNERTGNWTGVTVDGAKGVIDLGPGNEVSLVDLPGIYSLAAYSKDEAVARKVLATANPDLILNVLDASNLERSLYLSAQLMELGVPMVFAVNQSDIAQRLGIQIEYQHLANHVHAPVIPVTAVHGEGIDELKAALATALQVKQCPESQIDYDPIIEDGIKELLSYPEMIKTYGARALPLRWWALQLLLHQDKALRYASEALEAVTRKVELELALHAKHTVTDSVMDARRGFVHGLTQDVVQYSGRELQRFSDKADRILLNQWLGIPVFACVIGLVFLLTTYVAQPFVEWIDVFFNGVLVDGGQVLFAQLGLPDWLTITLAQGVGGGVAAVLTFAPPIFMIFFCLSLLEESGYMARAVFVMDKSLRRIGLPGKAFIPLLVGFGCTVPAIMSCRTLTHRRDQILTMLMTPFMSCGARLPVYSLFAMAFFAQKSGLVIFALYLIGVTVALLTGWLLNKTLLRGKVSDFVMELPPYHLPVVKGCIQHALAHLKSFVLRAGAVIVSIGVIVSMVTHALQQVPADEGASREMRTELADSLDTDDDQSVGKMLGEKATYLFAPMGITKENWQAPIALAAGIVAKEVIVGSLAMLYQDEPSQDLEQAFSLRNTLNQAFASFTDAALLRGGGEAEEFSQNASQLRNLRNNFGSKRSAFAFLIFVLLYVPCTAAMATMYREAGLKWTLFLFAYTSLIAWCTATLFYQIATVLLG